jgi:hypothetical protein
MPNPLLDPPVDPVAWFEEVRKRQTELIEMMREENGHVQRDIEREARERLDLYRSWGYPCPPATPHPDDL